MEPGARAACDPALLLIVGLGAQLVDWPADFCALFASSDRTKALGAVAAPTLVVHGEADPLVDVSAGRATAAAIPGARLMLIPGLGHDFPPGTREQIAAAAVVDNADRARFGAQAEAEGAAAD